MSKRHEPNSVKIEESVKLALEEDIGIGDIQISTKLNFYSKNKSDLYFITSLEIPTGSKKKYFGNDEFDGLIALNLNNLK